MRNMLVMIFAVVMFGTSNLYASNGIGEIELLYASANVEFSLVDEANNSLFEKIEYISEREDFEVILINNVESVQLINDRGELEFQMPIMSKNLNLDLADYDAGEYIISLKIDGYEEEVISQLTIK